MASGRTQPREVLPSMPKRIRATVDTVTADHQDHEFRGGFNMKGKLVVAVVCGLVVGVAIPFVGQHREAHAQKEDKAQKWEYKVVAFTPQDTQANTLKVSGIRLNELGAEGWEYLGPICTTSQTYANRSATFTEFVAFKRP